MEGRDIGTVVFPMTPHKFYLDASADVRAQRRYREQRASGTGGDVGAVRRSLARRDAKDSGRATAPLQIALGARVIDTTDLGIDEVARLVAEEVREREGLT
jgi:cytidylate kinase